MFVFSLILKKNRLSAAFPKTFQHCNCLVLPAALEEYILYTYALRGFLKKALQIPHYFYYYYFD